jgi:hypothetical protein
VSSLSFADRQGFPGENAFQYVNEIGYLTVSTGFSIVTMHCTGVGVLSIEPVLKPQEGRADQTHDEEGQGEILQHETDDVLHRLSPILL